VGFGSDLVNAQTTSLLIYRIDLGFDQVVVVGLGWGSDLIEIH
jgi:hypothetical protein